LVLQAITLNWRLVPHLKVQTPLPHEIEIL